MRTIVTRTCFVAADRGRFRNAGVRFRTGPGDVAGGLRLRPPSGEALEAVSASSRRLGRPPSGPGSRAGRWTTSSAPDRRRGGATGAREQPRHPDRAARSADRGSQRRRRRRRRGRRRSHHRFRTTAQRPSTNSFCRQPGSELQTTNVHEQRRRRSRRCRGAAATTSAGTARDRRRNNTVQHLSAAAQLVAVAELLAAAAAQLQHRQHPAAAARQPEEPRDRGRRAAADARVDDAHRAQRLLGPRVRARLAGGAAAVARPGAGVAAQHALARRDRHHAADRHHRGGGRSRARAKRP